MWTKPAPSCPRPTGTHNKSGQMEINNQGPKTHHKVQERHLGTRTLRMRSVLCDGESLADVVRLVCRRGILGAWGRAASAAGQQPKASLGETSRGPHSTALTPSLPVGRAKSIHGDEAVRSTPSLPAGRAKSVARTEPIRPKPPRRRTLRAVRATARRRGRARTGALRHSVSLRAE